MDSPFAIAYILGAILSIVAVICFFGLCYDVSEIRKHLVDGVRQEKDRIINPTIDDEK